MWELGRSLGVLHIPNSSMKIATVLANVANSEQCWENRDRWKPWGTLFYSTIDPLLIHLLWPLVILMPFSMRDEKGNNIDARLRLLMPSTAVAPLQRVSSKCLHFLSFLYNSTIPTFHHFSIPKFLNSDMSICLHSYIPMFLCFLHPSKLG